MIPPDEIVRGRYEVIVVGAGHAGCEAALASARMGRKTLLLTMNLDSVALMPCNPSMGGPAKGHLIKEIDALGGEIGRNTDRTFIQMRLLNTSKGPAVQALRAQCDKQAYRLAMKFVLEGQPNLELKQVTIARLLSEVGADGRPRITGVVTTNGWQYEAGAVVMTTGTFINGRLVVGEKTTDDLLWLFGLFWVCLTRCARSGWLCGALRQGLLPVSMHVRLISARLNHSQAAVYLITFRRIRRRARMCSCRGAGQIRSIR